jgi:divalent metal cation (Fe/Co/Zn/Cd) transporter
VRRHRFDLISMLLGIAVVIVGIEAINSRLGNLINDRPHTLVPLVLLGAGIVVIGIATRRSFEDVHRSGDHQNDGGE